MTCFIRIMFGFKIRQYFGYVSWGLSSIYINWYQFKLGLLLPHFTSNYDQTCCGCHFEIFQGKKFDLWEPHEGHYK